MMLRIIAGTLWGSFLVFGVSITTRQYAPQLDIILILTAIFVTGFIAGMTTGKK